MSGPLFWKPTQGRGSSARVGSTPPPPGPPVSGYVQNLSDDGSSAGMWPDSSAFGNDATQATVASQPAIIPSALNGRQGRLFDGTDDFFNNAALGFSGNDPFFYSIVLSTVDITAFRAIFCFTGSELVIDYPAFGAMEMSNGASVVLSALNVFTDNSPCIITISFDGSTLVFFKNGVQISSGSVTLTTANTDYSLGYSVPSSNYYWSGYFFQVLVYPSALSSADRQLTNAYLGTKWDIPLGQPQITLVDFTGLTGANFVTGTNGLKCKIYYAPSNNNFIPWVNTGTESNPGDPTGIEVDVLVTDFDSQLAAKFGAAMGSTGFWTVSGSGAQVVLTDVLNHQVNPAEQLTFPVAPVVTQTGASNS